jgi:hypothetical protein
VARNIELKMRLTIRQKRAIAPESFAQRGAR